MKNPKTFFIILAFSLLTFCFFLTSSKFAFGEDLFFTLNTNGYTSGTWTNKNVNIEVLYGGTDDVTYQYSQDNQNTWQNFGGQIEFESEGIYSVFFRLKTFASTSLVQSVNIKLDKTNPTFNLVSVNNFLPTSDDVVLTVLASDTQSNVAAYKFGISDWQAVNTYNVTQNTTYEIGSILIRDEAGNITAYNEKIEITNIDKHEPIFTLFANTQTPARSDVVTFQIPEIISGIDTFFVTMPNGKIIDITNTYQNGFKITQNGQYVFTLKNNAGLESSMAINYDNILGIISNFELFLIICVGVILIIIIIALFLLKIINKIKLNKNKKTAQ